MNEIIREYLLFKVGYKEVTDRGYLNRKPSDFYRLLRMDANRYNCSILDVLNRDANFVINGKLIQL